MKLLIILWTLTLCIMIGLIILIAEEEGNHKVIKVAGITNHLMCATCGVLIYCKGWKESRK